MSPLALRVAATYKSKKTVTPKGKGGKKGEPFVVYEYSDAQIASRDKEKAARIEKLRKSIDKLRSKVKKDLSSDDPATSRTALAVYLCDHTGERIGNSQSAEDGHYGVTGWTKEHVTFGKKVTIKYTGKSGVDHEREVTDATLKKALRKAYDECEGKEPLLSYEGGKVTAAKVNEYLSEFDVSAKDLRGYRANTLMRQELKKQRKGKLPEDKKEREKILKKEFLSALDLTCEEIGHSASMLRNSYLSPGLEDAYMKDGSIPDKIASQIFYDDLATRVINRVLSASVVLTDRATQLYSEKLVQELGYTDGRMARSMRQHRWPFGKEAYFFSIEDQSGNIGEVSCPSCHTLTPFRDDTQDELICPNCGTYFNVDETKLASRVAARAVTGPLSKIGLHEYDLRVNSTYTGTLTVDVPDPEDLAERHRKGIVFASVEFDVDMVSRDEILDIEDDTLRAAGSFLGRSLSWSSGEWELNRAHNTLKRTFSVKL